MTACSTKPCVAALQCLLAALKQTVSAALYACSPGSAWHARCAARVTACAAGLRSSLLGCASAAAGLAARPRRAAAGAARRPVRAQARAARPRGRLGRQRQLLVVLPRQDVVVEEVQVQGCLHQAACPHCALAGLVSAGPPMASIPDVDTACRTIGPAGLSLYAQLS